MRIGRLFALCMLSVTALAVVLGAQILIPQYRTFAGKGEAITAVEAYGTLLAVGQQVAGYRAPYSNPMYQEAPATQAQRDNIAKAVQAADGAFARARTVLGGLDDGAALVAGLDKAQAKLTDLRAAGDRALALPMSGRDPAVVEGFQFGIAEVIGMVEPLLNRLETRVATADAHDGAVGCGPHRAGSAGSAGGAPGLFRPRCPHRQLTAAEISASTAPRPRRSRPSDRGRRRSDRQSAPGQGASDQGNYFAKAGPWLDKEVAIRARRRQLQHRPAPRPSCRRNPFSCVMPPCEAAERRRGAQRADHSGAGGPVVVAALLGDSPALPYAAPPGVAPLGN